MSDWITNHSVCPFSYIHWLWQLIWGPLSRANRGLDGDKTHTHTHNRNRPTLLERKIHSTGKWIFLLTSYLMRVNVNKVESEWKTHINHIKKTSDKARQCKTTGNVFISRPVGRLAGRAFYHYSVCEAVLASRPLPSQQQLVRHV